MCGSISTNWWIARVTVFIYLTAWVFWQCWSTGCFCWWTPPLLGQCSQRAVRPILKWDSWCGIWSRDSQQTSPPGQQGCSVHLWRLSLSRSATFFLSGMGRVIPSWDSFWEMVLSLEFGLFRIIHTKCCLSFKFPSLLNKTLKDAAQFFLLLYISATPPCCHLSLSLSLSFLSPLCQLELSTFLKEFSRDLDEEFPPSSLVGHQVVEESRGQRVAVWLSETLSLDAGLSPYLWWNISFHVRCKI